MEGLLQIKEVHSTFECINKVKTIFVSPNFSYCGIRYGQRFTELLLLVYV